MLFFFSYFRQLNLLAFLNDHSFTFLIFENKSFENIFLLCNALSEHFAAVGARFSRTTVASDNDPPLETFMGTSVDVSTYLRPATHDEIRKIIFEMKSSLAGSDSINLLVLTRAKSSCTTCDEA